MFHVIFIFSDWILIKQIIVSSTALFFALEGNRFSKHSTWSFEWGTGVWVKMHRFNSFSNVNTMKTFSHTWWNIKVRENWTRILERDKTLRSLKKWECIPEVNIERQKFTNNVYQFVGSNLGNEIFLKKREHQKKGVLKQKIEASLCTLY